MNFLEKHLEKKLDPRKFPNHIAFIIDGNGRWAKRRDKIRSYGHRFGVQACKTTIDDCLRLGIKYVSMYGFSTENWNRPQEEHTHAPACCGDADLPDSHRMFRCNGQRGNYCGGIHGEHFARSGCGRS